MDFEPKAAADFLDICSNMAPRDPNAALGKLLRRPLVFETPAPPSPPEVAEGLADKVFLRSASFDAFFSTGPKVENLRLVLASGFRDFEGDSVFSSDEFLDELRFFLGDLKDRFEGDGASS